MFKVFTPTSSYLSSSIDTIDATKRILAIWSLISYHFEFKKENYRSNMALSENRVPQKPTVYQITVMFPIKMHQLRAPPLVPSARGNSVSKWPWMDTQNYNDRLKIRYLVIKTVRLITIYHCLNQFGKVWTSDFRSFLYILVGLVWTNGPELAASWFLQGPGSG